MQNTKFYATLLILAILARILSLSSATLLINNVVIRSTGEISTCELFDNCDSVDGWMVISSKEGGRQGDNSLEVDASDKVEGAASLKMTWAATGPNWGGVFYKGSSGAAWDFSERPVVRMRFKASDVLPANFKFAIIIGAEWKSFTYNIFDKITTIGEWLVIDVDLRFPETYVEFPDLRLVRHVEFQCWDIAVDSPATFRIDFLEKLVGSPIPLEAYIEPETTSVIVNNSATFQVFVRGGREPYSYEWYINDQKQTEESSNFVYFPTTVGEYAIKCVVTDAEGASLTLTATLTVTEPVTPAPPSLDVFKSEVRGMFVHCWDDQYPDWELIAQTCLDYGINTMFIEVDRARFYDFSTGTLKDFPLLHTAIDACHRRGLNVHIVFLMQFGTPTNMAAVDSAGTTNWMCVTKQASRQMLKAVVEKIAREYDIDGFMFDYIRWRTMDMCFCDECKAKFIADTGLTDVVWPTDVLEGGRYYWNFLQWRMIPITETVRDIRNWMLALRPNLTFSAAVFTALENCGNYWVMRLGQHAADWVDKGYVDFITPMLLGGNPTENADNLGDSLNFYVGGSEGKVPVIPSCANIDPDNGLGRTLENFVEIVTQIRQSGADGWMVFRYGGPGLSTPGFVDVRPYLAALNDAGLIEPVWAIQNLSVSINPEQTQATVSWTTTAPTRSKIEYSSEPIFGGVERYGDFERPIYYIDMDYVGGTIQEDTTLKTEHSFTIPITDQTQFRIQSIDQNGITVTSQPMSVLEVSS